MKNIAEININGREGRQIIAYNPDDGKLYSNLEETPIDDYTYDTFDEAVEAVDVMYGRTDVTGAWMLEWIEE